MNRYTIIVVTLITVTLTACGGGSSGSPTSGTSAGQTTAGEQSSGATAGTTAGTTTGASTGDTTGGGTGLLSDIVGVWDISRTGDDARAEYWDIKSDGTFNAYIYRDLKSLYLPLAMDNLDVIRCFENEENTISAAGNDIYTVTGLFADERYGTDSFEFKRNADGTLQAKYPSDLLVCGENGCGTERIDRAYPAANSDFDTTELFLCPSVIAPVDLLITSESESENGDYWECSFINIDDRTAVINTANIKVSADSRGVVTANDIDRDYTWFSRQGSDLGADYTDGTGGFNLNNLIFYSVNAPNDRFTALQSNITVLLGEAPVTSYFESDCNKRTGSL